MNQTSYMMQRNDTARDVRCRKAFVTYLLYLRTKREQAQGARGEREREDGPRVVCFAVYTLCYIV